MRTCVGCRRTSEPHALIRISALDLRVGRGEPGRGAWLCAGSPTCFETAVRKGTLARALRRSVTPDDIAALRATLETPHAGNPGNGER